MVFLEDREQPGSMLDYSHKLRTIDFAFFVFFCVCLFISILFYSLTLKLDIV